MTHVGIFNLKSFPILRKPEHCIPAGDLQTAAVITVTNRGSECIYFYLISIFFVDRNTV